MTVELSAEQELIRQLIESGQYADERRVVEEGLRLLKRRDELRAEIRVGLEQLDRGDCLTAEEVFADLRNRIAQIEKAQR